MKKLNTKLTTVFVVFLLMASVTLMAVPVQPVQAQTALPSTVTPTNVRVPQSQPLPSGVTPSMTVQEIAYLSFAPSTLGVGQPLLINTWLQPQAWPGRQFVGYMVTLTKPDGSTHVETFDAYLGDATAWLTYLPDQIGTWKIKFDFPGGYFPAGNYSSEEATNLSYKTYYSFPNDVYYKPASDGPYEFVVQAELVQSWPDSGLPNDYWTRPVNAMNREWWSILGAYPATGMVGGGSYWPADTNTYMSNYGYIPYTQAPNSAHIVWKRLGGYGGLVGGPLGTTSATGGGGNPSLIFAGRAYQSVTKVIDGKATSVWQCYDLRTGEVFWERTDISPIPNMVIYIQGWEGGEYGLHGSTGMGGRGAYLAVLSGGRLIAYNPYTLAVYYNVSVSPFTSGTLYADTDTPYFLSILNSGTTANPKYRLYNWTVANFATTAMASNITMVIQGNISFPFSSLGVVDYESGYAVTTQSVGNDASGVSMDFRIIITSILTGQVMHNFTANVGSGQYSSSTNVADHGKFATRVNEGHWHCWDLSTGKHLWKAELSSWPWGIWGAYGVNSYGGNIIYGQYDGVAAYDWDTGEVSWFYQNKAPYAFETPYQDSYPFFTSGVIADGKFFIVNTEHTPSQPITRGWSLCAINATTGEEVWKIKGTMSPGGIHDGYLSASNGYDGYQYVFGKGKSATTVTASPKVSVQGSNVLIEGTVLDQSPAQPGTPCVSFESMSSWMEYLHEQQQIPANVTGVSVSLDALDPNGNFVHIGEVTSDGYSGTFGYTWEPEVSGQYTVTATFIGDVSYGSSFATTYVSVSDAPAATATPEPTQPLDYTGYFYAIIAGVIVAIIISLLAFFKKR